MLTGDGAEAGDPGEGKTDDLTAVTEQLENHNLGEVGDGLYPVTSIQYGTFFLCHKTLNL